MDEYLKSSFHSAILAGDLAQAERILELKPYAFDVNERLQNNNTALHLSIGLKNLAMTKLLLRFNADAHRTADEDDSCLHLAVKAGDASLIDAFLLVVDVNVVNKFRRTPLHVAAMSDDYESTKHLLENGADVNAVAVDRETALHEAVKHRNYRLIELLLHNSANPNAQNSDGNTPCYESLRFKDPELLTLFVNHGASLTLKNRLCRNALHIAASANAYSLVKRLIDLGVDVNAKSDYMRRASLHLSLLSDVDQDLTLDVVQLLIENQALPDIEDAEDRTPLYYAAQRGRLDVVRYLLSFKPGRVDLNHEQIPLFAAIRSGNLRIVEYLVDCGARVNRKDYMADGPLHVAIAFNESEASRFDAVQLLLDRGASVHDVNLNGSSVLHLALMKRDDRLFHYLVKRGASISARNSLQQCLLNSAASYGRYDVARYLMDMGLDPNVVDSCGQSPLSLAVLRKDEQLFLLLLEYGAMVNDDKAMEQAVLWVGLDRMVHALIRNGFDIEAYTSSVKGPSLLVLTIKSGQPRMVRCLMDLGCDVNKVEDGALPLKHALDGWRKRDTDNYLSVLIVLIKRIAVLSAMNVQIHPANWEIIRSVSKMIDAFQSFRRELDVMRVTRIVDEGRDDRIRANNITYFHVLAMSKGELARVVGSCERVDTALRFADHKRMFVNYAEELEASYANAVQFLARSAR